MEIQYTWRTSSLWPLEQSLNNAVGPDSSELEALAPNLFLLDENSFSFPSLTLNENFDHRKRYMRAQAYANAVWQRRLKEYVPSLNKRSNWHADSNGD